VLVSTVYTKVMHLYVGIRSKLKRKVYTHTNTALERGGWSTSRPGHFSTGKRPGTHFTGGWVGFGSGLD